MKLDVKDRYSNQPLHIACKMGMPETAIHMVRNGAPLDVSDREGKQPLHIACKHGRSSVAEVMIQQGAPLMTLDKAGFHPLNYALCYSDQGNNDVRMQRVVAAIFNHPKGRSLVTPNLVESSYATMQFDAACGVALAWRDDESPVHASCRYLEPQLLARLIAGGLDITMVNASGNTPLHLVAMGRPSFLNGWRC